MRVILLEKIEKLGVMGDLVTVKPGYARNFLLPRKKALRATPDNEKRFAAERARMEADSEARKTDAAKTAAKLDGSSIILVRAASEMGQLYGSATSRDIAAQISAGGKVHISRNQVALNTAIKTLGLFPVKIILHPEVSAEVTVNIARSEDEAKEQQKLGRAIISDIAERERLEAEESAAESEDAMLDDDAKRNRARESGEEDSDSDTDADMADDTAEMVTAAPADDGDTDTADSDSAKPVAKKKKAAPKKKAPPKAKAKTTKAKAPAKAKAKAKKAPAKKKAAKKKA